MFNTVCNRVLVAVEVLILVFFALIGVVLMKFLMGDGSEQSFSRPPMPPPGPYSPPQSPYSGYAPYPPAEGYYMSPPPKKKKILIMPESTVKAKKRRRRI